MNIQKISKALGAVAAAAAGSGVVYFSLPAGLDLPSYVYVAVPIVNMALAFVVTYFAPSNAPANATPAK